MHHSVKGVARPCVSRPTIDRSSVVRTTSQQVPGRLNRLRAGVLGANDGIVPVAAIVVGVAGSTSASAPILTAGTAGLVGGAISMALGEYVSVGSRRDSPALAATYLIGTLLGTSGVV